MTVVGWLQFALLFAAVLVCVKPLGIYLYRVFEGERTFLSPVMGPVERATYAVCRANITEMSWGTYAFAFFAFQLVATAWLYLILLFQDHLPFNPQHFAGLSPDLAFNTTISFVTNTNWQFYSGETTLSYFSQMAGLTWHMFTSAASGICVALALIRGIVRTDRSTLGNYWVDMTRTILYVFAPLCFAGALVFLWQGVPQNFSPYTDAVSIEGAKVSIPQGPMASMEVIKELGNNGGGFVNANSASPDENPNAFTNWLELFLELLIPAALTYMFGRYARDQRQGWVLFSAMAALYVLGFWACYYFQSQPNPLLAVQGIYQSFEGLETRFGIAASAMFAITTTATSTGAVNAMHDSFLPMAGAIPMINIQTGEVIFGGVGAGMYGILEFVIFTVFIAGLMVGRTPEYLGKMIERRQVVMASLAILSIAFFTLVPASIAVIIPAGVAAMNNAGPHGFSEILYMTTSMTGNNGSAFAGISGNTFTELLGGVTLFGGRYAEIIPVLGLAGSLAGKRAVPFSSGTFKTTTPLFIFLLVGVVMIVGVLTFLPGDALGPFVEHLLMLQGKTY
ncbi:MAG: potassium-transporting ATPase subunit KdpA [Candidatus Eremiobacteraeota bacterium]|nr:potassium-transporting ATPase subunit KdpA [Candidatus Eremiobacteraeota bacterium]